MHMAIYADMARGNVEATAAAIAAAGAEGQDQWGLGLSLGYSGTIFSPITAPTIKAPPPPTGIVPIIPWA